MPSQNLYFTPFMKKVLFIVFIMFARNLHVSAQEYKEGYDHHFLVLFADKGLRYVGMDSLKDHFTEAAIARREKFNIPFDSLDLPVTKAYMANIMVDGVDVRYPTRWLNGAVVTVKEPENARLLKVKFFVRKVIYIGSTNPNRAKGRKVGGSELKSDKALKSYSPKSYTEIDYGKTAQQVKMLKVDRWHKFGDLGNGIKMAVFDAGYYKYDRLPALRHLTEESRVLGTYDVVDLEESVSENDAHGMHVLGCMAGFEPGTYIGTAPAAEYFLFRTEDPKSETLLEELNWVRAAEMADSLGIDIINSSLGYTTFDDVIMDHTHNELDGVSSYIARAAGIANSRGMLVVSSAGNDGNKFWKKLNTPADVASTLTVGAVTNAGNRANFSSVGPTSDGRIKPDVSALGHQSRILSTYGSSYTGNGTSYSAPIMAGMMACMMERYPNLSLEELCDAIRFSSNQAMRPDTLIGYGVPDAHYVDLMYDTSDLSGISVVLSSEPSSGTSGFPVDVMASQKKSIYLSTVEKRIFIFIPYRKVLESTELKNRGLLHRAYWHLPEHKRKKMSIRIHEDANGAKKQKKLIQEYTWYEDFTEE